MTAKNCAIEWPQTQEADKLEQLLRIADGDREALALLYEQTRNAVYAVALSCLGSVQDAQDITQDTYVQVWETAPRYRAQGSPMAWLFTVTRNLARMKLRRGTHQAELTEEEWAALPARCGEATAEEAQLLREVLLTLDERERQLILLHAVTGMKHREIAAMLGLPLSTVLSKYHRALKKLRIELEGDDVL